MINSVFLAGVITHVKVSTPKDPTKQPSAVLTVKYGPDRNITGREVEFCNAVQVRVPNYKWPQLADKIKAGLKVEIRARLQGLIKPQLGGLMSVEVVAERVDVVSDVAAPAALPAAAAPAPAAA